MSSMDRQSRNGLLFFFGVIIGAVWVAWGYAGF